MVETGFPFAHCTACAFGRDGQHEFLVLAELVNHSLHIIAALFAIDRNPAHVEHEVAHRPSEQSGLGHEMRLDPQRLRQADIIEEIPVRCVRGCDDDEAARLRNFTHRSPALPSVKPHQQSPHAT